MSHTIIVSDNHSTLAPTIAHQLGLPHLVVPYNIFASTEVDLNSLINLLRYEENVLYVHQFFTAPEASINESLFRLLLSLQILKTKKVKTITLLLPYLPYSRQDKAVNGISTYTIILEQLRNAGVNNIITYDIHNLAITDQAMIVIEHKSTTQCWIRYIKQHESLENLCIASPDYGAQIRAYPVARELNLPIVNLSKKRREDGSIVITSISGSVQGKRVIIIDDIIDTGKTALASCRALRDKGAISVVGYFSHAVLSTPIAEIVKDTLFEKIVISNSLLTRKDLLHEKIEVIDIVTDLRC